MYRVCVRACARMYRVLTGDQWESVFLLAGDDLAMHLYRESLLSEVRHPFSISSPPLSLLIPPNLSLVSNPDPSLFRSAGCIASPARGGKGLETIARFLCSLEEFA